MLDLTEEIRTLGLYQPFAGLMLHGKIESRFISLSKKKRVKKKAPFPLGNYLIYSTASGYSDSSWMAIAGPYIEEIRKVRGRSGNDLYALGKALCIGKLVEIIDPLPAGKYDAWCFLPISDDEELLGGRFVGLKFEPMLRIKPFPFKGKQGIGFLSDEDKKKIQFV